ncbi:MAG TPA: dynamin family protein [Actinomycetales bacterium]|nr:dynamin family protein [Actinomycetales bacterium]
MEARLEQDRLLDAVTGLRERAESLVLPLDVEGVAVARRERVELVHQLDDYVLPRLRALDAPLLAVVGGSTGAGKSTLVNSVLRESVTRSGVLRPTTRAPVLVHHPDDRPWFEGDRVLPSLARVTGAETDATLAEDGGRIRSVRLVASAALPPGLALLDAPDIDSVVSANRELAQQLLAAADLWIFVTTAARYADAVPWDLLRGAAERGASVAIVLDRVPPEAMTEVRTDLEGMLKQRGLESSPLFSVPESRIDEAGLLEADVVRPVHSWLVALARDAGARQAVIRRTLTGALESLRPRTAGLVAAARAQDTARQALRREADEAYSHALARVQDGLSDGSLLRGEVLARWQEFVGTGELLRHLESRIGRLRDHLVNVLRGRPAPEEQLGEALQTGVEALITAQLASAAEEASRRWRGIGGGPSLVAARPDLATPTPGVEQSVSRAVRDWQGYVLELVRTEGGDKRSTARVLSYGVNAVGVMLMLVVFSQTAGLSGAEVGIAGGTAVLAQRLLEAVFGDQAVRTLAAKAKAELLHRAGDLLDADRSRYERVLDDLDAAEGADAAALERAVEAVEAAR